jgi:hypothetical protein
MVIFKKAIPRRTMLRGMGTALALPLLDCMVPALTAEPESPVRLGFVHSGNGMWPMDRWTPKIEGPDFEITPTLEQLTPYRNQLLVLSGLAHNEARPRSDAYPGAVHIRAMAVFLSGVRPKLSGGKGGRAGITVDQIAADKLSKDTQLRSLEVSLYPDDLVGTCESGASCVFLDTLSWRTETTPLPMERSPRGLFQRMFGDSDTTAKADRLARLREQRSILDTASEQMSTALKGIGPSDRAKMNQYLEAVRDVERRIQLAEQQSDREVPTVEAPLGVPASFEEYAKMMIDLIVVAFQTDLTRVLTFSLARELSGSRSYPEIGITDQHHALSHHQNNPVTIEKLFKINQYHMKVFAYLIEKLRSTKDGSSNLLDNSLIMRGAGLSNGNLHQDDNLPILLLGGGGGQLRGGRHIRYPEGTPLANLYLTLLDKLGIDLEKLGDSNGKLNLLSV